MASSVAPADRPVRNEAPGLADCGALAVHMLRQAAEPIVACDAAGTLILVNDAAHRLARVDLEGKSLAEAGRAWGELYEHGQRIAAENLPLQRALRGEADPNLPATGTGSDWATLAPERADP